jgi:hypothetical protein
MSETIAFLLGFTLCYVTKPGWFVGLRRNGRWVWEVSRIPCKECPLAKTKEPQK